MIRILKKTILRIVAVALTGTLLCTGMPRTASNTPLTATAADTCVINRNITYQTIRGFGGINHPEWTGQDMTESQRQTAFGNGDNQLGLTVLRVFVNPDSTQWYRAVPTAKYASDMGVTVFASPWEPPSNLAESGGSNGKLHLPRSNYAAYAQHLNDFGTYMKNNGVDLYAISVQNEPDYASEWTYWSTDETTDFIANYGDQITSTRLMSPESFQYAPENASWVADGGKTFYRKILNNQKAMENCDLFGTHFYGTQRSWMDFPDLENCGKEIWMTEVYVPNSDADSANRYPEALQVAENIHNGLVVGNMSAYVWWYIRRSYGLMTEDGAISKRGYCMAQYSKYVRPGSVRIDATEQPAENVYVSAYRTGEDQMVVVAINMGSEGYAQYFNVGESIENVDRYRTSANENLAHTANLENADGGFWAQLPAESISTFVIDLADETQTTQPTTTTQTTTTTMATTTTTTTTQITTAAMTKTTTTTTTEVTTITQPQPDENGYYFHDTFETPNFDWIARGDCTLGLSGRAPYAGTNALLISQRTAVWNGASKNLDLETFKPGESYAFSVIAQFLEGKCTEQLLLTLEYTDSANEVHYLNIDAKTAVRGAYVQLYDDQVMIPVNAKDAKLVVETAKQTTNFYIDEAIGAISGTQIYGPAELSFLLGDLNGDRIINCVDLALARQGIQSGFTSVSMQTAADVDQNGMVDSKDLAQIQAYVLAEISGFTDADLLQKSS